MKPALERRTCIAVGIALLGAILTGNSARATETDAFESAHAAYRAYMTRPSLFMHTRGRRVLARTGDPRALATLVASYATPEKPRDQVRYLIVEIATEAFASAEHVQQLVAWRTKHDEPEDAWLWYRTLVVETNLRGPGAALAIARTHKSPFLRAAALEALATAQAPEALALVEEILAALPRKTVPRALLIEGLASVLRAQAHDRETEAFQRAAELLIARLDDPKTPARSRLVLARYLAGVMGHDDVHFDAGVWRAEMKGGRAGPTQPGDRYGPPRPTFVGLKGAGRRIAYLIDASDSMLTPLTSAERRDLKRPPPVITPSEGGTQRRQAPTAKAPELPWEKIHTRFDAAREYLKRSLRSLPKDAEFVVILFGTQAETLDATPGLVKAGKGRVKRVVRELDRIEAGRPQYRRPHGVLKGFTNMHGALHRAFKARKSKLVKGTEYVQADTFEDGCDTIFVLSDGRPSWDDWPCWDAPEAQDRAGDPESCDGDPDAPLLYFSGPYWEPDALSRDEQRLNLLRHVQIHCVGIGEADPTLLRTLAGQGQGSMMIVGAPR